MTKVGPIPEPAEFSPNGVQIIRLGASTNGHTVSKERAKQLLDGACDIPKQEDSSS